MSTRHKSAKTAGWIYFVFAVFAVVNEFFLSAGFIVPGDAAATARNILADELRFRIAMLASFANLMLFAVLIVHLYDLFVATGRKTAMLMLLLVSLGIAVSLTNLTLKAGPLVFLGDAGYLASFSPAQREALSQGTLAIRGTGNLLATLFWGLWLFPFGVLVRRSGYLPKVLGLLLFAAGLGYVATGAIAVVAPDLRQAVAPFLMPLYFGELPIIFWLLFRGAGGVPRLPLNSVASRP